MKERKHILVTVKTYPQPSEKYHETVCTAGVCKDGSLIRIYPFPFRTLKEFERFKKYQWIEVDVERNTVDPRPESFKAFPSTLKLGELISSKKWDQRLHAILKSNPIRNTCDLMNEYGKNISLSIVKPKKIIDFIYEEDSPNWNPKQENAMKALWLDRPAISLEKIPWRFKFKYLCNDPKCKGHSQTIEDWEVFQLFRKMKYTHGDERIALNKVRNQYLNNLCSPKRDPHFFVGMHNLHRVWMIIGFFSPPKRDRQLQLL
ncbi:MULTISPECIES: hypothetical protein [unclassified Pseudodesulfovibrio]|uniref:hypothetical protein n=1 Tax=unclassified Pseudodesulfovibrio TaxID=2661612 RepID=UPI000FEBCE6B|nr:MULTISPECIES: hypothetical protein [unclassified Pseudodesulfovibrio]MCJ2166076.1 hypothetical protein [Pseudodesulfovibrio sp. S3-i]